MYHGVTLPVGEGRFGHVGAPGWTLLPGLQLCPSYRVSSCVRLPPGETWIYRHLPD